MINKYLISIYTTFSDEDWKKYKEFIKSCDAISGRKYYPLVSVIQKNIVNKNNSEIIPVEKLFKKAYGKSYRKQTLLNRQTELVRYTKNFLKNCAIEKVDLTGNNLYSGELQSRNLLDLYEKDSKEYEKVIEKNLFNEDAYKDLQEHILLSGSYYQRKKKQRKSIDVYFLHSKVLLADILCSLYRTAQELQIYKFSSINFVYNPVLEFIESIDADKFFNEIEKQNDKLFVIPLIRYYIFKSIKNPENKKFISKAKKIFFAYEKFFKESLRIDIYRLFMTYYIFKINKGESVYYDDLFLLYKRKLKQNLVEDIRMCSYPANVFREYILTGIKVNQFKWVENVIKKYSVLLPENIRSDEVNLATIRLLFAKGEFKNIMKIISDHKTTNVLHYLDSMRYKLACFYELGNLENAYLLTDTLKHYLINNKNKIPEYHIYYYKNFLDKILKLLNLRSNPFNKTYETILYEIKNETVNYMMKDWIDQKYREIYSQYNKAEFKTEKK